MSRIEEMSLNLPNGRPLRLVALGDTHLKRNERIAAEALAAVRSLEPDAILHTGDVSWLPGLADLEAIAPLYAVRGNRDVANWRRLAAIRRFQLGRLRLLLFHGYGSLFGYMRMKLISLRRDPAIAELDFNFPPEAKDADMIVYGHTHVARVTEDGGRIIVNPGALTEKANVYGPGSPKFALIEIDSVGSIRVEIRAKSTGWHEPCIIHTASNGRLGGSET